LPRGRWCCVAVAACVTSRTLRLAPQIRSSIAQFTPAATAAGVVDAFVVGGALRVPYGTASVAAAMLVLSLGSIVAGDGFRLMFALVPGE
jgi:hypothetical protein